MRSRRLRVLLPVLALLAALRVAVAPEAGDRPVVEAIVRTVPAAPVVATRATSPHAGDERPTGESADMPGNAFAVRSVASLAPAAPVAAAPAPVTLAVALPPPVAAEPAAEPMPPLSIVGSYDDGQTQAVFVATPGGIRIARTGTVLLSEYQVAGIAPERVTLMRVSDRRPFELPLPAAGRP